MLRLLLLPRPLFALVRALYLYLRGGRRCSHDHQQDNNQTDNDLASASKLAI